jgi:hypothetical protein
VDLVAGNDATRAIPLIDKIAKLMSTKIIPPKTLIYPEASHTLLLISPNPLKRIGQDHGNRAKTIRVICIHERLTARHY